MMRWFCLCGTSLTGWPGWLALSLWMALISSGVLAQDEDCEPASTLQHTFSSGASWRVCAQIDAHHGLALSSLSYRAPGDRFRSVLSRVHLSQILLHYHNQLQAEAQIRPQESPTSDAASSVPLALNEASCDGDIVALPPYQACSVIRHNRTLSKYAQRPSLHGQSWELASAFSRGTLNWTSTITLTEDGQIRPALSLSGRASRHGTSPAYAQTLPQTTDPMLRATLLATWRVVFNLDTAANDQVEQFDFELNPQLGNRRPMRVSPIVTETLRRIDRENFRGWRVRDASGAGYYLDPSNNGFRYTSATQNWAQFDVAFTRFRGCERHALFNTDVACNDSLDDFVNGEPLINAQPVLWFSQSRTLNPRPEDWPVIHDVRLSFDLLPFDWTATSPFTLPD